MIETLYLQNIVIFVKISYSPCYFVSFSSIFTRGVFSDSFLSTTILVRLLQTPDFLGMLMSTPRSLLFLQTFLERLLDFQLQWKNLYKGDMWHIYGVKFRKIFLLSLFTDYLHTMILKLRHFPQIFFSKYFIWKHSEISISNKLA